MSSGRVPSIQILRGFAAAMVVFDHAVASTVADADRLTGPFFPQLGDIRNFGASGVDLFFIISGFVIAHTIGRDSMPGARAFLVARAIRVLPMFWIVGGVYAGASLLMGQAYPIEAHINMLTIVPLVDGALYHAPPLYVGWTLGFELCFYGLAAVVLAARPGRPVAMLLALSVGAALMGLLAPFGRAAIAFLLNPIVLEFAMGIVVWGLWRRGLGPRWSAVLGCAGLSLLVLFLCADWTPGFSVHYGSVLSGESSLLRALEWGFPFALIVAGCCGGESPSGGAARWMARIGDASYSLYLVHPLVMLLLMAMIPGGWRFDPHLLVALLCIAALAVALPLHRLVEAPLLAWMRGELARYRGRGGSIRVRAA
jgi:peptidoglycan/LPS O-acetylase OafA/YrhL